MLPNAYNIGYAAAINQGLHHAQGEWICLLGPDTVLHSKALQVLRNKLKSNPKIGMASPQLLRMDHSIQPSCRYFPAFKDVLFELTGLPRLFPHQFKPEWKMPDFDFKSEKLVDQPEATCLLIRKKAFLNVGLMDEQFPIFFNDVDWCRRFCLNGWQILFTPESKVTHMQGASVCSHPMKMIWKSHQGFYRYFRKYSKFRFSSILLPAFGMFMIITACLRSIAVISGIDYAFLSAKKYSQRMR